MLNGLSVRSKK